MAAEILLGIKISAIRLNKDDNLPEYNVECLLQATFVPKHFSFVKREKIVYKMLLYRYWWNIDTDEIPGFFLLLKNHIFIARSEDTIFNFHVWGSWCRRGYWHDKPITGASRSGSSEISFTKWLRGAKTVQLPVTFASAAMSCQIFTSILFPSVMIIQGRFADVSKIKKSCLSCRNFISIYKINRTLHGRLGIRILSSNAESIYREWDVLPS